MQFFLGRLHILDDLLYTLLLINYSVRVAKLYTLYVTTQLAKVEKKKLQKKPKKKNKKKLIIQ